MLSTLIFIIICSSSALGSRISGGTEAVQGEVPWQISIQDGFKFPICGGSIISTEYILTAKNCDVLGAPNFYRIVAGALRHDTPGSVHGITEIKSHHDSDISIWKVIPPFVYDTNIKAVYLPDQGTHVAAGTNLTISGWGATEFPGDGSDVLLIGETTVISKADCNATLSSSGGIGPDEMCTEFLQGGVAPCAGDKGGPLMRNRVQRGIATWSLCGDEGKPTVYVEVSAFRNWIADIAGV